MNEINNLASMPVSNPFKRSRRLDSPHNLDAQRELATIRDNDRFESLKAFAAAFEIDCATARVWAQSSDMVVWHNYKRGFLFGNAKMRAADRKLTDAAFFIEKRTSQFIETKGWNK